MTPWITMALNNAWANATLYASLSGMSEATFIADRPGFFPSLAATLNHIHEVDLFYLDALEQGGQGWEVRDRAPVTDPAALGQLQSEADMRFAAFCQQLKDGDLEATRVTRRPSGSVEETVSALILHLVQHQIHHRGQAHVQLSHAGVAPPQLDEFYLTYDRAPSAAAYW